MHETKILNSGDKGNLMTKILYQVNEVLKICKKWYQLLQRNKKQEINKKK